MTDLKQIGMPSLRAEVETAMTYARLARDAGTDPETRDRHRRHAQDTRDMLLDIVNDPRLSIDEVRELRGRILALQEAIADIP